MTCNNSVKLRYYKVNKLIFRVHAIRKMFERSINRDDVRHVIDNGEVIREYLDDKPFPSRLILGWREKRPLQCGGGR